MPDTENAEFVTGLTWIDLKGVKSLLATMYHVLITLRAH